MDIREIKTNFNDVYIIPLGDIHMGDKGFGEISRRKLQGYIDWVKATPNAFVFLLGDLVNCATLAGPSSPFQQNMDLSEQVEAIVNMLKPIKDKILGAIDGNHENRLVKFSGYSPTISICERLGGITYFGPSGVVIFRLGCRNGKNPRHSFTGYFHHCFDKDTELLTRNGWKKWNEIRPGEDEALTLNIVTGNMEWNIVKTEYLYDDFDKMVHFKSKTCDLMVTKDHTLINTIRERRCWDKLNNKYNKDYAKDRYKKENNFPCSGKNINKEYPISDEMLKLLAWVLTEGTTFKNKKYEVRITQSDKPKVGKQRILDIIEELKKEYSVKVNVRLKYAKGIDKNGFKRNYDAYEIYINKCELSKKIRKLIPDKHIPDWFFNLSKKQFDILLYEMLLGDGTFDKRKGCSNFSYSQKDKKEIDKIQALCSLNGYRTTLGQQPDGTYRLSMTKHLTHRVKSSNGKIEKYSGKAWCVSVDNKTLVVRRNGKVTITGNTTGGGRTIGAKLNRVDMMRDIIPNADFYCGGHNHQLGVVHNVTHVINQTTGGMDVIRQMIVDCGGYLEWKDSYAESMMLPPLKIGSPRIHLMINRKKKTTDGKVDEEVTKDIHVSI